VIVICAECCDGCGACVEACPTGALFLVDGKAAIEASLCRECEACIPACPTQAIAIFEQEPESAVQPIYTLARRPEPAVIQAESAPLPVPWRARVLPAVGAALAWAGREIVPRLADYVLYGVDRWMAGQRAVGKRPDERGLARSSEVQPWQRRHRRRGRSSGR